MDRNAMTDEIDPEKREPIMESDQIPPALPDFRARARAIFDGDMLEVSGAELIRQDRDRY
jgi:hypothetical protein